MMIDGRNLGKDGCENAKEVVSKFGVNIVCDEEELKPKADVVMPMGEECENVKKATSKYGVTVVCEEE